MKKLRWDDLERIFGNALSLDREERASFIASACDGNDALRREVEDLLREDASSDAFLDGAPAPASTSNSTGGSTAPESEEERAVDPLQGSRVGPYRLLELLGEGGMGVVYLAARDDGSFKKRVAVKLLRPLLGPSYGHRLEAERQILASLDHPYIARVLDGGTATGGRPYVVMEYVEGRPIDAWCSSRNLGADERIDLFLDVCAAVSAAHRNLIVHCDLKPSNILVTDEGKPKLLDFGIAKLLSPEELGLENLATQTGQHLLTPAYASPEQLRGEKITVATDVYLLGLVLFRLLSGTHPFSSRGRSRRVQASSYQPQPVPPPSTVLVEETAASGVRVEPDLDAIVLKALRPEPESRYPSVEQLAEDLQNYRQGLPVRAVQGTWRYRGRKFFLRHRVATALAVAIVGAICVFAGSWIQQKQQIERALSRSRGVERFLEEVVLAADPRVAKGKDFSMEEALQRAAKKLDMGLVDQPEVEATLQGLLGRVYLHRGQYGAGRDRLEKADHIYSSLPTTTDRLQRTPRIRARSDLAVVRYHLAEDESAAHQAEDLALEAVRAARRKPRIEGRELLNVLGNLGLIYCLRKKGEDIVPLAAEMLALARLQSTPSTAVAEVFALQALTVKNELHDLETSRELYQQALAMFQTLEGDIHPEVATLHNQLGLVAEGQDRLADALIHHEEALRIREHLYSDGNHVEIAQSHSRLASVLQQMNRPEEALPRLRLALLLYQNHPDRGPSYSRTIGYALNLAELLLSMGRWAEASEVLEDEIPEAWWTARPEGSRLLAWAESVLGRAVALEGRRLEARALLLRATRTLVANPEHYERQAEQSQGWLRELNQKSTEFSRKSG